MIGLRWLPCVLLMCGGVESAGLLAQAPAQAATAYPSVLQIPVLALSPGRLTVAVIKPEQFSLSIDNGPRIRPTNVRPEGADPISLTVVLDFMGEASELMPAISESVDHALSYGLTPQDHVSLFVMQCTLNEVLHDQSAVPGLLHAKLFEAAGAWAARDRSRLCKENTHLWDALAMATRELSRLPGHRAIVAVSDGVDRGSQHKPVELATEMQTAAVTTFGLMPGTADQSIRGLIETTIMSVPASLSQMTAQYPLQGMSEMSGGITLPAARSNASKQFARIPELLRGRYIVEFARPAYITGAGHTFDVKVAKSDDIIRQGGSYSSVSHSKMAPDPQTVRN